MIKKIVTLSVLFSITFTLAQQKEEKVEEFFQYNGLTTIFNNLLKVMVSEQEKNDVFAEDSYWEAYEAKVVAFGLKKIISKSTPLVYEIYTEKELDQMIEMYKNDTDKLLSDKLTQLTTDLGFVVSEWSEEMTKRIDATINLGKFNDYDIDKIELEEQEVKVAPARLLKIMNVDDLKVDTEHNYGSYIVDLGDVTGKKNVEKYIELKNVSDAVVELDEPFKTEKKYAVILEKKFVEPGETIKVRVVYNGAIVSGKSYRSETIQVKGQGRIISFGVTINGTDTRKLEVSFEEKTKNVPDFYTEYSEPIIYNFTNTGEVPVKIITVESDNDNALLAYSKSWVQPGEKGKIFVIFSTEVMEAFKKTKLSTDLSVEFAKDNGRGSSSFSDFAVLKEKLSIEE
jgi:hypothetical protein